MRIDRFLSQNRIIDLQSRDFASALGELLEIALPAGTPAALQASLKKMLLERESVMPTRVGDVIALPHVRAPIDTNFIFAIGRLPKENAPFAAGTISEKSKVVSATKSPRIIFLMLASEKSRLYHSVLSELVYELDDADFLLRLQSVQSLKDFRNEIVQLFRGVSRQTHNHESGTNRLLGRTAERLAKGTKSNVMLFFADTFTTPPLLDRFTIAGIRTIIVSSENYDFHADDGEKPEVIIVRAFSNHRMSQLRAAMFIGIMRGVIKPTDRVCCLGGTNKSDKLDSILVLEAAQEFPTVMTSRANTLVPAHVRPEVLERTIAIATELAAEGREGKPVGTMLIVGEREKIKPFIEPLIMNPFNGYGAEDRNILNPFMVETVKELALIDGAFVINGDGVIESAGSFVTAARSGMNMSLPGGLGTRHAAACAISLVADCAAIVVSTSGQITLFRHGEPIILLERSVSRIV